MYGQQLYSPVQYYSVPDSPVTSYQDPMENKRQRRHDLFGEDSEEVEDTNANGRLLSPSAFSKISETLGALNTVGRYLVNMTRGGEGGGSLENSEPLVSNSKDNVPDAILTLTSNVLGKNLTKTIEPLIKRVTTNVGEETVSAETSLTVTETKKKKKRKVKTEKKDRIEVPGIVEEKQEHTFVSATLGDKKLIFIKI